MFTCLSSGHTNSCALAQATRIRVPKQRPTPVCCIRCAATGSLVHSCAHAPLLACTLPCTLAPIRTPVHTHTRTHACTLLTAHAAAETLGPPAAPSEPSRCESVLACHQGHAAAAPGGRAASGAGACAPAGAEDAGALCCRAGMCPSWCRILHYRLCRSDVAQQVQV